ncbi:MAG: hypothetical protein WC998_07380 [Candidatus Paceibacterota bacterium]|jgi:hypothetical protein
MSYGIYGVRGRLVIAHDREEALRFLREHVPYKSGYEMKLKMMSGRGTDIKVYMWAQVRK